ncbi:hypothetical protein OHA51_00595 [Streptomyces sp. NBC_00589]|nr:hypothetical protein [Streptomyces sp. NBC_00589]WTI42309.1 hypothetical protein OIC96_49135 [Streptomyces sp. NBC_00775]WUB24009.1 hypothetical protein OHA51_00595 [Streptomyces sp. NBC_00589]
MVVEAAGVLDNLLRHEDGVAGGGLDTIGQGQGRLKGFAFAGELVDESVPGRARGGQRSRGQEHLHGHVARETDGSAFRSDESAGDFGQGEERGVSGG